MQTPIRHAMLTCTFATRHHVRGRWHLPPNDFIFYPQFTLIRDSNPIILTLPAQTTDPLLFFQLPASMARTRSAKLSPERQTTSSPPQDDNETPPTPSFSGALAKFQYEEATTATHASSEGPPARSRVSKRTRTTITVAAVTASSPRPKKRRKASTYADPSKYAHLEPLVDIIEPNLICVFVGTNPGEIGRAHV